MSQADRKAAQGKPCTLVIQGPWLCASQETVVLAHAPHPDRGMAYTREVDWWGAYACHTCHDLVDRRRRVRVSACAYADGPEGFKTRLLTDAEINAAWMRGIYRTIKLRREELMEQEGEDDGWPF